MEARVLKLGEILGPGNIRIYQIPKYQREYSWGKKECTTLFNDIVENQIGYFLGSIICVKISSSCSFDDEKITTLQLIDGQQRMTSLSLLLLALYSKIEEYKSEFNRQQDTNFRNLEQMLVYITPDEKYVPRLIPQVQNNNKDDYFKLLYNAKLYDKDTNISHKGNRRITYAFKLFQELIEKIVEEESDNDKKEITILFNLFDKINDSTIVAIEVADNKKAYMLFESLNNRGLPLSAIDLIKNNLISLSDDPNNPNVAEKCYNQWEHMLGYLTDNYGIRERFFRQYYNAFRDEINANDKSENKKYYFGNLATKSTILEIYEVLMEKNYQSLLDDLEAKAKIYAILINNSQEEVEKEMKKALYNLEHIQGAPCYLLLLYIFNYAEKFKLSIKDLIEIINYLVSFFVRRNITDYPATRNLNKLFMDCIDIVKKYEGAELIAELKLFLKHNSSSNDTFEEKLRGNVYINNVDNTRFLLSYYEMKFETSEIFVEPYRKENGKYVWTIEHIFPEGDNIPIYWINMIANGDKSLAEKYLEEYAHTFGNLTLTGYNPNLSNLSFEEKKNKQDKQKEGKYIGFKNKLALNNDVVSEEKWTIDCIKKRTEKFVTFFLKEFKL